MSRLFLIACTLLGALPWLAVIALALWPDRGIDREVRRRADA